MSGSAGPSAPKPPPIPVCGNCGYTMRDSRDPNVLRCQRYPPLAQPDWAPGLWPIVPAAAWCGEYVLASKLKLAELYGTVDP